MESQFCPQSFLVANVLAATPAPLRVAIRTWDPAAHAHLASMLAAFDDILIVREDPDVTIADSSAAPSVLTLSREDVDHGTVQRSAPPARIHAALHAVAEGLDVTDSPRDDATIALTAREQQVLQLLAAGLTNKEIASRLGITDNTVKFHVNGILGKLAVETRTEAVVQAARLGMVTL